MSTKNNQRKAYRLIFVCIFVLISFFSFVFPKHDRSWFGEFSNDFLGDTIFTVSYFKVCKDYYRIRCAPVFQGAPFSPKVLNLNGIVVSADMWRYRKYFKFIGKDMEWRLPSKAFRDWNKKNPKNIYYKPSQLIEKKKLKTTNLILNYFLFIISVALIWFKRDFSITIVNSIASLVSKGWKKL